VLSAPSAHDRDRDASVAALADARRALRHQSCGEGWHDPNSVKQQWRGTVEPWPLRPDAVLDSNRGFERRLQLNRDRAT
jgi:hypothetical protein